MRIYSVAVGRRWAHPVLTDAKELARLLNIHGSFRAVARVLRIPDGTPDGRPVNEASVRRAVKRLAEDEPELRSYLGRVGRLPSKRPAGGWRRAGV